MREFSEGCERAQEVAVVEAALQDIVRLDAVGEDGQLALLVLQIFDRPGTQPINVREIARVTRVKQGGPFRRKVLVCILLVGLFAPGNDGFVTGLVLRNKVGPTHQVYLLPGDVLVTAAVSITHF